MGSEETSARGEYAKDGGLGKATARAVGWVALAAAVGKDAGVVPVQAPSVRKLSGARPRPRSEPGLLLTGVSAIVGIALAILRPRRAYIVRMVKRIEEDVDADAVTEREPRAARLDASPAATSAMPGQDGARARSDASSETAPRSEAAS